MKKIPMNDDNRYDVDLKLLEGIIDIDTRFVDTELSSLNALNNILQSKIEMKSHIQTINTGNLFIEFEIDNKGNSNFINSGLNTTQADKYFLNISDDLSLLINVSFLKYLLENKDALNLEVKDNSKSASNHIGKGLIIPMYLLIELLQQYNSYKQNLRIKELHKTIQK